MNRKFVLVCFLWFLSLPAWGQADPPLRVFIRAGEKTHGPDQHDHPRFLREWTELLRQRGARAEGAMTFPTAEQLEATDVLVMYAQDAGNISPEQRANLDKFLKRGGGIVAIHDAVCGTNAQWFKTVIGGAWEYGAAGWFEGEMSFYYQDHEHPITRGASNFDFDDELYYHLNLMPEAHILATTYQPDQRNKRDGRMYPSVYDLAPQMWTYEKDNYRAFVCIPGHNYKTFNLPHFRAVLLRGIAWAGKRDVNLLASKEELASLLYPEGGPTAPEKAAEKIIVPPDFTINLVASEPLIEKPISLDWDPRGRLWVAETPEYPFRGDRSRPARDRISILEATNGDGRMDKKSVFYEGLDLVTSMVFYRDGVIVSQAPDIYWLRDTKGTGKADTKVVLFTGFGTNDTHAVINNLRWGLDGWIYATVGYSRGDIYSGDRKKHFGPVSDGVIRFRPDGSAIEQFCSKSSNTWGVDIAPDGEVFFSQANGNHIDHVVMPEFVLTRGRAGNTTSFKNIEDHNRSFPLMAWKTQAYVQIDWVGNFTAAAGACIYDGGAWPEKYNYNYFVAEPTINIVHQDILKPDGVTFVASKDPERLETEFIASRDLWFRPIHIRVGPDGALYVLDFYNQAVVHNDTRGPRHDPRSNAAIRPDRDHYFGRIWRVQNKEAKPAKVPNLAGASAAELVKALEHPNEWVRLTALRLWSEQTPKAAVRPLEKLADSDSASAPARIHALWALNNFGRMSDAKEQPLLVKAVNSTDPAVRKNALKIAALPVIPSSAPEKKLEQAAANHLSDPDPRVRLEAITAIGNFALDKEIVRALVEMYPGLKDPWLESAAIGVAAANASQFIEAMLNAADAAGFVGFAAQLTEKIAARQDADNAARLVILAATKPAAADPLKQVILEGLTRQLKQGTVPIWSPELQAAFRALAASSNPNLGIAALPLISRWDKAGSMANELKTLVQQLAGRLEDASQPDDQRARLVVSLLAVRQMNADILPAVARIPGSSSSPALQRRVLEALGALPDAEIGALLTEAFPKLPPELQEVAANQLFKRPDWSLAFLDAVEAGKINLSSLGPVEINRLRTHSDPSVADRANKVIDRLRGPEQKEKDALIARFTPQVVQPGSPINGRKLFTQNCAICHRFKGEGKDIAPDLTGMGAHGPAELIIHVLDPNREVEPNYYAYSVETKDGEIYDGVIARENPAGITLRNAAGDVEIKNDNIKRRRNTGLSLMPNGFEALGGDSLRDILAYLCADDSTYRVLDLKSALTANGDKGIYLNQENTQDRPIFRKFGLQKVEGVPFDVINPLKSPSGRSLVVLKGGEGLAKTFPQKVGVPGVNVRAAKLHFLGGVGGWGYPCCGNDNHDGLPVAKVTVHYDDHQNEEIVLTNGREFADWAGSNDVPGSKAVPGLVSHGQVRWFTKSLKRNEVIESLTLESFDNVVAPTFVAITAELAGGPAVSTSQAADPAFKWGNGIHVLIVGGGSSHDFNRWFNLADTATLNASSKASVNYTEAIDQVLPALKDTDVLYLSNNQPMKDEQLRRGIFEFADSGHGLLLMHPGVWYNWKDWPEYNRVLVGGGANGHDKYGEFEVTVTDETSPLTAGVPKTFRITDELYHFETDTNGTPIQVLAEGKNLATGKTYPVLWIVKHPHSRIVGCTLGHDGQAHDLPAYKTILQNSVIWAAGK